MAERLHDANAEAGRRSLTHIDPGLTAPGVCNQRLNLTYYEALSKNAFNFNLRRYTEVERTSARYQDEVRRCRLTPG